MARVTSIEVKEIISTDIADLTAYITAANLLVTEVLGGLLSDALLKEIERWLSAHLIASGGEGGARIEEERIFEAYAARYGGRFASGWPGPRNGKKGATLKRRGERA